MIDNDLIACARNVNYARIVVKRVGFSDEYVKMPSDFDLKVKKNIIFHTKHVIYTMTQFAW